MNIVVPLRGGSGHIYRLRIHQDITELPQTPGIFCFMPPLPYPTATPEPLLWDDAPSDIRHSVTVHPARMICARNGAIAVGALTLPGEIARRRAVQDLLLTYPGPFNAIGDAPGASGATSRREFRRNGTA
jgi:hypothetical protein